jgi:hypothetical protein
VPGFVGKNSIDTDGKDFGSQILYLWVLGGNCRQLGRSYKGEICGIKIENYPFACIICQFNLLECALMIGLEFKIWCLLSNFKHSFPPLVIVVLALITFA